MDVVRSIVGPRFLVFACWSALATTACKERSKEPAADTPAVAQDVQAPADDSTSEVVNRDRAVESGPSTYREPPEDVVSIVDAPGTPAVVPDSGGARLLLGEYERHPSIADVAEPFDRLAGIRIDPRRWARQNLRHYTALSIQDIESADVQTIELPEGTRLDTPRWSPDGSWVAFTRWADDAVELWVADPKTGASRRLGTDRLNTTLGAGFEWMPDLQSLLIRIVPRNATEPPERPQVPEGPVVEDTRGQRATNRTYQDLLEDAHDERRFEHLATSQLAIVELDTGETRRLGEPGLIDDFEVSPDGRHILIHRIRRPFSYAVPYWRFARTIEVFDLSARVERVIAEQGVAEEIPIGGVRQGARDVHWRAASPATLVWTEALDEGDPKKEVEHRDRLMSHAAPFADVPTEIARVEHRLTHVAWLEDERSALLSEYDRDRRWTRTWLHDFQEGGVAPKLLVDRSIHDVYGDPGDPVYKRHTDGSWVVAMDDGAIFLQGEGASPEGDRPFLDRMALADGHTERLFQSESGTHAQFEGFLGDEAERTLLIRKESPEEPPNYFVLHDGALRRLTEFPHPHPQLTGIEKRVLTYRRRDGVKLSGTLYLPPGYREGERVPLVVWAYPVEYTDKETAGQVRAAPGRFTRLGGTSPLLFLTQGYAVLDDAAMPVVGDPETMNDGFVDQIVWAAEAAVDAAVEAGVADRDRVGIAGHSYGAFMTANLLAHSDVFRAGIARSGAYNRTLTPFGFQSERRTLWEATSTYIEVSPLFAADKLDEPILLVHGAVDANSGTYPLQTMRMFHALKGNGGVARMVVLPHESHGYTARESVLHVLAESFEWFERHVKNAESRDSAKSIPAAIAH